MFCTRCGAQLGEKDRYCSQCAHPTVLAGPPGPTEHRLTRDPRNGKIAGVCAGFARYFGVDVVLVRVVWIALLICGGVGIVGYIAAWIIMPKEPAQASPAGELQPAR